VLSSGVEARVKVGVDFIDGANRNLPWQRGVHPAAKTEARNCALGFENAGLTEGVDAGVSTRGSEDNIFLAGHRTGRLLEMLLHGRAIVLTLPAA